MKIMIVGAGMCGQGLAKVYQTMQVSHMLCHHTDNYESIIEQHRPILIVNAAAIAGHKACDIAGRAATYEANVDLAVDLTQLSKKFDARCVLLSTSAVYARPNNVPKKESDALHGNNLYIESKIDMENMCSESIIFRFANIIGDGIHPNDYINRIKQWKYVVDTYDTTIHIKRFADIICRVALHNSISNGIYNIADPGFKYLPDYVRRTTGSLVEVMPMDAQPNDNTVSHLIDTTKAKRMALL